MTPASHDPDYAAFGKRAVHDLRAHIGIKLPVGIGCLALLIHPFKRLGEVRACKQNRRADNKDAYAQRIGDCAPSGAQGSGV